MKTIEEIGIDSLANVVGGKGKTSNVCIGWCPGANQGNSQTSETRKQHGGVQVNPSVNLSPLPPGEAT